MNNELAVINYEDAKMIATLKATVAKNLNDEEFKLFAGLCQATKLNPFRKEIWAFKGERSDSKMLLMTGVAGFYAIANSHPEYDGIESGLINPEGEMVGPTYNREDYIGSWSKVYRKDRKIPMLAVAMLSEYKKSTPIWGTMKRTMITKCSESVSLRKSFPQEMNNLYTEEEMNDYDQPEKPKAPDYEAAKKNLKAKKKEDIDITPPAPKDDMAFGEKKTHFFKIDVEAGQAEKTYDWLIDHDFEHTKGLLWVYVGILPESVLLRMKDKEITEAEYNELL